MLCGQGAQFFNVDAYFIFISWGLLLFIFVSSMFWNYVFLPDFVLYTVLRSLVFHNIVLIIINLKCSRLYIIRQGCDNE
jgi:hypothetical protein